MTTVAINYNEDGNIVIASDSRMTGKGTILSKDCVKIFEIQFTDNEKAYVTGAGSYAHVLAFLDWVVEGMDPDKFPKDYMEREALLITKDGVVTFDDYPRGMPVTLPASCGSGDHIAGRMVAGATPEEAVKIAAEYDPFTDSNVVSYVIELEKKKKPKRKKKGA